jgi:hypothetical protein
MKGGILLVKVDAIMSHKEVETKRLCPSMFSAGKSQH